MAKPTQVLIIKSDFTSTSEIDSLSTILVSKGNQISVLDIEHLRQKHLKTVSVVIYHRSDSTEISNRELQLKKLLLPYVQKGGSLLLSMDAVRLMNQWEIEPVELDVEYQNAIDYGYGRAVGFHGYREHPIYDGLHGGAYTWKATVDNRARTIGFSGDKTPKTFNSKVLGINWAYIHYHESRKLVWETPFGKGKILNIGGYMYFSQENVNKLASDIFIQNCVSYLAHNQSKTTQGYWQYDSVTTQKHSCKLSEMKIQTEAKWQPKASPMEHSRSGAKDNFWNVSGQQILALGKEIGGIDEVWIHPVMAMRDYQVGVKLKGSESVFWLNDLDAVATKRPESFERKYKLQDGSELHEFIMASLDEPLLVLRYDWTSESIERVYVNYTSNLRLMWPYSLDATGTLFYAQSSDGRVSYIHDRAEKLNMLAVFDKLPLSFQSGETDFKNRAVESFNTEKSKHKQVSFLYEFSGKERELNFYLSGGELGLDLSANTIQQHIGKVEELNSKANSYYADFDKHLLSITSNDELFNEAYRWALISTDKFYCYTSSIGSSLMSGYFSTARGWNGGHEVSGRPGYAWYFGRDTEFSSLALTSIGDYEKVQNILTAFANFQAPEGKIYHELTASGSVHYDASDATPLYITLAGYYLKKSGDLSFIRSQWESISKAIDFCYSTDTDGDLLIENTNVGHGWQEGWQLYGAHTEVYLASIWAAALREASFIAESLGLTAPAKKYKTDMEVVIQKINENFWNESLGFYNHGLKKDGTYQEEKCVLGGTPIFFDVADADKALLTAENFSSKYYSTDWGVRMVGYNSPYYVIGGYNYGNIWPFFTGLASLEEFKAGLYMQGFRHVLGSLKNYIYWDYGNLPEVLAGDALEFSGICTQQQWSTSMAVLSLADGMLGLRSDALSNSIRMASGFPVDWSEANVKNIYVGNKSFHMDYKRDNEAYTYNFNAKSSDKLKLTFSAILPLGTQVKSVHVNGENVQFNLLEMPQNIRVELNEIMLGNRDEIKIFTMGGVGVCLNLQPLNPGVKDVQLKIEKEWIEKENNTYNLLLAGVPGESYDVEIFERSDVQDVFGAELKGKKDGKSVYTVTFPKVEDDETFVNKTISLKLK